MKVFETMLKKTASDKIHLPWMPDNIPPFLSSCKKIPETNNYLAYYKNGNLYDINPRNVNVPLDEDRETAYNARYIISDGVRYDLESAESITNIIIPEFNIDNSFIYATRDLSYILKMRATKENRPLLAIPLCYKVANIMIASPIAWSKKDFYRLVIQLWSIGAVAHGDFLLSELNRRIPEIMENKITGVNSIENALNFAKEMDTDYIHADYDSAVCAKCSAFQNRVYSISGNDKRFPKLPNFIIQNNGLHCPVSFYAVHYYDGFTLSKYIIESNSSYECITVDAIEHSNRPFDDYRTDYEKQCYEERCESVEKIKRTDEQYYNRERWIDQYKEHLEYQHVVELLGADAPKDYSSYKRMKKNQTATFKKIQENIQKGMIYNGK